MREVRDRVAARREAGEYGRLDDTPTFAELAMHDELAASANRMAAAARTTGLVPPLTPSRPGREAGRSLDAEPSDSGDDGTPPNLPEGVAGRLFGVARRVADRTFGSRLSNFLDRLQGFIAISADNSRVTAERVIALDAKVNQLEQEVLRLRKVIRAASKGSGKAGKAP